MFTGTIKNSLMKTTNKKYSYYPIMSPILSFESLDNPVTKLEPRILITPFPSYSSIYSLKASPLSTYVKFSKILI